MSNAPTIQYMEATPVCSCGCKMSKAKQPAYKLVYSAHRTCQKCGATWTMTLTFPYGKSHCEVYPISPARFPRKIAA